MFKGKKILALIGARSGSKGIKRKNILDFDGQPLISWTIEAALGSKFIDRTIVSTDSPKIAEIAKRFGAEVPWLRPKEFAEDHSQIYGAIRHCLTWLENMEKSHYDFMLWLQPTSPLRRARHIEGAIDYYFKKRKTKQDILVSVTQLENKLSRLMRVNKSGYLNYCFDMSGVNFQRQNLSPCYLSNGAIYFAPIEVIKYNTFYTERTLPYLMKEDESIDIDVERDFSRALHLHQSQRELK